VEPTVGAVLRRRRVGGGGSGRRFRRTAGGSRGGAPGRSKRPRRSIAASIGLAIAA